MQSLESPAPQAGQGVGRGVADAWAGEVTPGDLPSKNPPRGRLGKIERTEVLEII